VTIVFDGPTAKNISGINTSWLDGFKATVKVFEEDPAVGFWGHAIRTKYQAILNPKTTFIMNADDDDTYAAGAFDALRSKCTDPDTLYIGKMNSLSKPRLLVPRQNEKIVADDIGGPSGIIPFEKAKLSKWGYTYRGDFEYYQALQSHVKRVVFLNDLIYTVGK
jgi:hypothetical protein